MNPHEQPCQATPAGDLRQQILDSRVPKNEREWWASREIEKLERELADVNAECDLHRNRLASLFWSGAIDKQLCGDVHQWAEDYIAELTRLRAELLIAENWVEHHSQHADDLIAENVKLRAEMERLTGERGRLQADLGEEKLKRFGLEAEACNLEARAEKAEDIIRSLCRISNIPIGSSTATNDAMKSTP